MRLQLPIIKGELKMKVYAVIMAGGEGTRFWPISRKSIPKQLLNLSGNDLMINETINRISKVIDPDDIFIITNINLIDSIKKATIGKINSEHILAEPKSCNTAACIGYAACVIINRYGDGIMCIFPSDHYIKNEEEFIRIINLAVDNASNNEILITIGITPTFPSTGYGYIKCLKTNRTVMQRVLEFKEKPSYKTAESFYNCGEYLWNSGIFVWKASTILNCFLRYEPDTYMLFKRILNTMNTPLEQDTINDVYTNIKCLSIDKCILECSNEVFVIPSELYWNDVGSWDMLKTIQHTDKEGNITFGDILKIDTSNSVLYSNKRLIATLGIQNLVIVETDDAILVCDKNRTQEIKNIVKELEQKGRFDLL